MKKIEKKQKFDPPKHSSGDTAYLVAKAVISPIPGASELLERFITPPLQKRTEMWMESIAETLRMLEQNQGIKLDELQRDELFITIVAQATTIAIRTHQKEKLDSLRYAIENSVLAPNKESDLHLIFIRYIDELTPSHLSLLSFFIKNEQSITQLSSYTKLYNIFLKNNTGLLSKDEFKMECGDLASRGLIRISLSLGDFEDIYEPDVRITSNPNKDGILPKIIVTEVAKKFVEFISSKEHNDT